MRREKKKLLQLYLLENKARQLNDGNGRKSQNSPLKLVRVHEELWLRPNMYTLPIIDYQAFTIITK